MSTHVRMLPRARRPSASLDALARGPRRPARAAAAPVVGRRRSETAPSDAVSLSASRAARAVHGSLTAQHSRFTSVITHARGARSLSRSKYQHAAGARAAAPGAGRHCSTHHSFISPRRSSLGSASGSACAPLARAASRGSSLDAALAQLTDLRRLPGFACFRSCPLRAFVAHTHTHTTAHTHSTLSLASTPPAVPIIHESEREHSHPSHATCNAHRQPV